MRVAMPGDQRRDHTVINQLSEASFRQGEGCIETAPSVAACPSVRDASSATTVIIKPIRQFESECV